MWKSKNCGHGCDLYIKTVRYSRPYIQPMSKAGEMMQALEDFTGEAYLLFTPNFCPICGKKVEYEG